MTDAQKQRPVVRSQSLQPWPRSPRMTLTDRNSTVSPRGVTDIVTATGRVREAVEIADHRVAKSPRASTAVSQPGETRTERL